MKTFVATPIYNAMPPEAVLSFAMLTGGLSRAGVDWTLAFEMRDSNQARARNMLFHRFLQSEADVFVSIDADQVFRAEDVVSLINALDTVDIVAPCIVKKGSGQPVGYPLPGGEQRGQLVEMRRIGFGMFVARRSCIEALTAARVRLGAVFSPDRGGIVAELVSQQLAHGKWLGVDDVFSDRWRDLGGKLWRHTGVSIGHVGSQVYEATDMQSAERTP